jgi:hypothetical protein
VEATRGDASTERHPASGLTGHSGAVIERNNTRRATARHPCVRETEKIS